MILTIEISDVLADRLRIEAGVRGEDLNQYALAKLRQIYFAEDYWDEDEEQEVITAIWDEIETSEAGQSMGMTETVAAVQAALTARRASMAATTDAG